MATPRRDALDEAALATEHALFSVVCEFAAEDGYTARRSVTYPEYYYANGLTLSRAGPPLAEWMRRLRDWLPAARHVTLDWTEATAFEPLRAEAPAMDLDQEVCNFMVAQAASATPPPTGFALRELTAADGPQGRAFGHHVWRAEPWYTPGAQDMLARRQAQATAALGIRWFAAHPVGAPEVICARAGVFRHGAVARFQDVVTAPELRRRGLASALVAHIQREALGWPGVEAVILSAVVDGPAIGLYARLGFVERLRTVHLSRYPKEDS